MAAITPAYGYESLLQIGREATWNTAVAATHKFGIIELEVTPRHGTYMGRTLASSISKPAMYQGAVSYEVRALMTLSYDYLMLFFDGVMGTATFGANGGTTTGAGPYTHTWLEKSLLNSYTLECVEGNRGAAGATGKCNRYYGAKIKSIKIHGEAVPTEGSACTLEVVFVAPSVTVGFTTTASLVLATESPAYFYHATTVDDGTGDGFVAGPTTNIIMKNFDITVDNVVAERYMIGLASMFEPQRNGFVSVQVNVVKELQTTAMLSAAAAFTQGSPKLVFDNAGSGAANRQFTFDVGKAYITNYRNPIRGPEIVEQTATWEAIYDSGNASALKLINISGQATITTAPA